jgi:hypothetical protein
MPTFFEKSEVNNLRLLRWRILVGFTVGWGWQWPKADRRRAAAL